MKGWDIDEKGNVKAFPVTGWSTAIFKGGKAGGLRFNVAMDKSLKNQQGVQLVLTPPQIRKLAEMLADFADKLEEAAAKPAPLKN